MDDQQFVSTDDDKDDMMAEESAEMEWGLDDEAWWKNEFPMIDDEVSALRTEVAVQEVPPRVTPIDDDSTSSHTSSCGKTSTDGNLTPSSQKFAPRGLFDEDTHRRNFADAALVQSDDNDQARRAESQFPDRALSHENHEGQVSDEDAGRQSSSENGCLLVTEADASLTSRGIVSEGTIVFRQTVKGPKRHLKIADELIEMEAATIRQKYSQEIKQNHTGIYHKSNQVEPALMVEEKSGEEWKYHPGSPRYYWEKTFGIHFGDKRFSLQALLYL